MPVEMPEQPQECRDQLVPSLEDLKNMVFRENELRLSSEWQACFEAAERSPNTDWLECVEKLQHQVAREFGYGLEAVRTLRTAATLYPQDAFFRDVPLYVRYNRARDGSLAESCLVPDLDLLWPDGQARSLWNLGGAEVPLVLVAGSHS